MKIDEPLPTYETKKGQRTRKDVVGTLYAGHDSLGGVIDVAMITSFFALLNMEQNLQICTVILTNVFIMLSALLSMM